MQLFDLTGKVAIVTGGNGGIGLGMARGLAAAGAKVVVAGRNAAKSAAAAKAIGGDAIEVDVKSETSLQALVSKTVKRHRRLDILVINAGINIRKQPQEFTLAEYHEVMNTNLTSAFHCSQLAYTEMKKAGGGKSDPHRRACDRIDRALSHGRQSGPQRSGRQPGAVLSGNSGCHCPHQLCWFCGA